MGMRVQDLGELTYGGLVTGAEQWDKNRVSSGAITDKDVLKKYSTYAYLVPGAAATVISAFRPRAMRQFEPWAEHISHGFIYDFPRFITNTIMSFRETGSSGGDAKKKAVEEAKRIVAETRRRIAAGKTDRTYQPEFEESQKFAW